MINLFKVRMSEFAPERVKTVLESGFIGQGSYVDEFEEKLQKELNTKYKPITVNSCTSAIELALVLCGVDHNSEVITIPTTCFATNSPIINRQATIKWADIDPKTSLIDPKSVEKLITNKTKAIIAVNWAGKLCDYTALKKFGIPVIEDAAHTWDVFSDMSGIERGDYICYSFQAIKYLTTGDGGILVNNDFDINEKARLLRWYGLDRTKGQSFRCVQNIQLPSGMKWHMNDINASIGIANIPEAKQSVNQQRENSKILINNIKNKDVIVPEWDETCSYWLFSMHVLNDRKQEFIEYMKAHDIESGPVHYRNDKYDCTMQFKGDHLPGVEFFDKNQVCIPNGWWLSNTDLEYIIKVVNNF